MGAGVAARPAGAHLTTAATGRMVAVLIDWPR